ncbi:hypothetical protein LAJ19_20585 (plasmid) [Deinococcus taeanensis]|uniref:hypothetical protein n=1 Tax=Deinococcus taeanensis TaxID=2737050 RepID=UPI001CDC8051|nr:hypothetical protein [Deinococcus taeanensis]UBV45208.1 hypothetical protein LAJ19_20585 [Deinococcus taeanensis]
MVLEERLRALQDEPRPALREWVQGSLTLVRTITSRDVCLHLSVLTQVERAARQARLAVPLMRAVTEREAAVLVFEGVIARVKAAKVVRRGQRVWSVTLDGAAYRLDARTGEVLGTAFTPVGLHVHRHSM